MRPLWTRSRSRCAPRWPRQRSSHEIRPNPIRRPLKRRSGQTGPPRGGDEAVTEMTYRGAVAAAIAQEMERDPMVVFIGEDIGAAGGVFKTTEGLLDKFGP